MFDECFFFSQDNPSESCQVLKVSSKKEGVIPIIISCHCCELEVAASHLFVGVDGCTTYAMKSLIRTSRDCHTTATTTTTITNPSTAASCLH